MSTAPSVVLFDLDGVLAHYAHAPRLERLARRCGARVEEVAAALFESGLEHDADLGVYDAAGQVDALARRLGRPVSLEDCIDEEMWKKTLLACQRNGIGAIRSQGYGTFRVIEFERVK